jgi:hypothetical protein
MFEKGLHAGREAGLLYYGSQEAEDAAVYFAVALPSAVGAYVPEDPRMPVGTTRTGSACFTASSTKSDARTCRPTGTAGASDGSNRGRRDYAAR